MTQQLAPIEVDFEALLALPPEQQQEQLAQLALVNEELAKNPLWLYVPHEGERAWKLERGIELTGAESRGQVEFHEIELYMGALVAGNQYGKTHVGAADALIQTLPEELLPPWLLPYKRYDSDYEYRCRVVGVDIPQWLTKVMLPKLRSLIPPAALWKGSFDKAYTDRTRKLQFADGSWWDFLTHDMPVDAFAGAAVDRVWFDEEPPGELGRLQLDESTMRVMARGGDVRFTLTPLLGLSHLYYDLTDGEDNPRDDDECKVVVGDMEHNPHLSERGRTQALKRFAKEPLKMEARKSGRWVHFAGQIYEEWRDDRHVVEDRAIPRHDDGEPLVQVYATIDPGINKDHQAALLFAWLERLLVEDEEGRPHELDRLEVFHEFKEPNVTVEDVASHYHAFCETQAIRPVWTTIDPSARNKHHQTGRSTQQVYLEHRVPTLPGQNAREAGWNRIKERLRHEPPLLVVQAGCPKLINEFHEYRYKTPRGLSEDAPKPEPIKRNDDELDALRYLVMSMPYAKPRPAEPEHPLSGPQRAFRESLRRMGRKKRRRIGGYV